MKLTTQAYYNPFFAEVNGSYYCLNEINVFDENGVIAHQNQGWFGTNHNCSDLTIPCDCVRKIKVDFKCKTAFIVKVEVDHYSNTAKYALYLPNSIIKLADPTYSKGYSKRVLGREYVSTVIPEILIQEVAFVDKEVNKIEDSIRQIGTELSRYRYSEPTAYTVITISDRIEELQHLQKQLAKAVEEMSAIPTSDFEKYSAYYNKSLGDK